MRRAGWLAGAAAGVALAGSAACSTGSANAEAPVTVQVRMHFSTFEPSAITVPAGQPITFVLRNDDFIDHEFIVGDAAMQQRHELGTEAHHSGRPTEVEVPGGQTVTTVVTFPRRTQLVYACHAPGHFAYGMTGTLAVH